MQAHPGSPAEEHKRLVATKAAAILRHASSGMRQTGDDALLSPVPARLMSGLALAVVLWLLPQRSQLLAELEPKLGPLYSVLAELDAAGVLRRTLLQAAQQVPISDAVSRDLAASLRRLGLPLLAVVIRLQEVQSLLAALHERYAPSSTL